MRGSRSLLSSASSQRASGPTFAANGFEAGRATFAAADVFEDLRERKDRYDLVICDPPPLARRKEHVERAARAYKDLNRLALERLEPGGLLFTFSCSGAVDAKSGVSFLDHMLDALGRHGRFDLTVTCTGDAAMDPHHTVEDIGITLGQAVAKAVGDKAGLVRYGYAYVPLDEALSRVVIDLSGRPGLEFHVPFTRAMIGTFDVDLTHEFFQGFVNHALVTLHVDNLRGQNAHHQAETVFKAFGRALRMAVARDPRQGGRLPSTKEVL